MIDRNQVGLMGVLEGDAVEDSSPSGEGSVNFTLRVRRGVGLDGQTILAPMFVRCRWTSRYAATLRPRLVAGTWLELQGPSRDDLALPRDAGDVKAICLALEVGTRARHHR